MQNEITTITLPLPYRMGTVNCFLVRAGSGFVLIDTGPANGRAQLESELSAAGCRPDNLTLILLTHGDFDHTGNASYLRREYGAPVAMHRDDLGMVQRGDMFFNRSSGNAILRRITPLLYRFGKASRFVPELFVEDGGDLSELGWAAQVLCLPGHSRGSIGILNPHGDLFCGDLLENVQRPALSSIMDEPAAAEASLEKLKGLAIQSVFPGHGNPFAMAELLGDV